MFGRYRSFLGTNALLCCDRYNWSLSKLISNPEHINYFSVKCCHFNGLSGIQKISAGSLYDLIATRWAITLPPLFSLGNTSVTLLITCAHPDQFMHFFAMSVHTILVLDLCT